MTVAKFKTLDDLPADLSGKVALVRVDLNLPMKDGSATDVTRVEAVRPTILELCDRGAKVLLLAQRPASHVGAPCAELLIAAGDVAARAAPRGSHAAASRAAASFFARDRARSTP